jgi:hypothetical protein
MPATAPPAERSAPPPAREQNVALSRDLTEFLIELAIALHQHAIYPAGHPLAATAAQRVNRRLFALLTDRVQLTFGVARRQLVIDGVLTDPEHPLLHDLALRFNRVDIGAVRIEQGAGAGDVAAFLDWVTVRDERALRDPSTRELGWTPLEASRIALFRHSYENLDLVPDAQGDGRGGSAQSTRTAGLWVGLAQAALSGSGVDERAEVADPVLVARVIDAHPREEAYDQVIVGYLAQITEELRGGDSVETRALERRVSRLVGALDATTLRQLLEMGGNARQRRAFTLSAVHTFSADALLDVVKAAAAASGQTISHSLVRVLTKLAGHAEEHRGLPSGRNEADIALRENVRRLVESWQLPDPNPAAYRVALEAMAVDRIASVGAATPTTPDGDATRVLQMCLELDAGGLAVQRSVATLLAHGAFGHVLDVVAAAPDDRNAVADVWATLGASERLRRFAADPAVALPLVAAVARQAGLNAIAPLLDELTETESRKTRSRIIELLPSLGDWIAPVVIDRLAAAPWYVQRNLFTVLAALGTLPASFSALPWLAHDDARVRREAARVALRSPAERERAIAAALRDRDDRVVQLALAAAAERCSRHTASLLRRCVDDRTLSTARRSLAVRIAASASDDPATLGWLLQLAGLERGWLGRARLTRKSAEQVAAIEGLARHWTAHPRARELLTLAAGSPDPDLRAAAAQSEPAP